MSVICEPLFMCMFFVYMCICGDVYLYGCRRVCFCVYICVSVYLKLKTCVCIYVFLCAYTYLDKQNESKHSRIITDE